MKKANPAATAVNNAGNGHAQIDGEPLLEHRVGREDMHDDSGAETGLRMRPDYGESDALSTRMNEQNAKGGSLHVVAIAGVKQGKVASEPATLYVTAVEWASDDPLRLDRFHFSSDRSKAKRFRSYTASRVTEQLSGPHFGASVRTEKI